jgi:NAD-dependent DNA ligase
MSKRYNEEFINLLDKLSEIMMKHGEPFRAKAYQKAQDSILKHKGEITSVYQLLGFPGIGSTIMEKFEEYVKTGTLRILEQEKCNPINILTDVYGIGPKKAEELVKVGVKTIADLRGRQDELLNEIQKIGLKFYEDILQRIPRSEIEQYKAIFEKCFVKHNESDAFEIVGSYRRGASDSGDIDIIITGLTSLAYKNLIDNLIKNKIILHVLSSGPSKTLVITRLPNSSVARRVDFLYAPINEFPFAILYFTGSKVFNTIMRQTALDQGYTFNEHGIYHLTSDKKKGEQVSNQFSNENAIFDFLKLPYKTPLERSNLAYMDVGGIQTNSQNASPTLVKATTYIDVGEQKIEGGKITLTSKKTGKNKTLKKKNTILIEKDDHSIQLLEDFSKKGISVLNALGQDELTNMLQYASKQYYNHSNSIITDNQFDIVKNFIETKFPANMATKEIGAEVERNKVVLPYEMASMDKIKPDTNALSNWCQKFGKPYVLSCKLDGVSGLYSFEQGSTPKLYTRGNGTIGQDVSHLIPYLKLPSNKNIVIRGEFIISKQVFLNKYANKFANIRNMVAGIINTKTIIDAVNDLEFVAYEVIKPVLKISEQLDLIKSLNMNCVLYNLETSNLTNEKLSTLLVDWRSNYTYEIDGIIVTSDKIYPRIKGNPEHAFAFKMVLSDQIAEAIVTDIIWTPSKDGYLKPRVQIEPLNLGGVKIEYATGFNGAFIRDNNVGIGATIQLIRSGDVIPHIKSIIVPAPNPKMPDVPYKWNDTNVDIILLNVNEDPIVKEKNITGFFKGIEVDGLGGGNVARIIETGYDTVPKIINMSIADFLKVEGFKEKMASKLYTGIQEKVEAASLVSIMAASNIFGRGFNNKKMELILQEIPDILISSKTVGQKIIAVTNIKGMADKTATTFVSKIEEFKEFLKDCGLENKLQLTKSEIEDVVNIESPLYKKTVVLTGTRDKEVLNILKKNGAIQGLSVSKNTFMVVAKSADDDTGKAEEARKLGIPIVSVDQFVKLY